MNIYRNKICREKELAKRKGNVYGNEFGCKNQGFEKAF